jgi:hypothetical protein
MRKFKDIDANEVEAFAGVVLMAVGLISIAAAALFVWAFA